MTVRTRLSILILSATLVSIVSISVSLWTLQSTHDALDSARSIHGNQELADDLKVEFLQASSTLRLLLSGDEGQHGIFQDQMKSMGTIIEDLRQRSSSDEEARRIDSIASGVDLLDMTADKMRYISKRGEFENRDYEKLIREKLFPELESAIAALILRQHQLDEEVTAVAQSRGRALQTVTAVSYILLLILAGLAIYLVYARFVKPVELLGKATEDIARGAADARIPLDSEDEFGLLARRFEAMARDIRDYQDLLVEKERLAIVGEMAAAVAHNVRNPLASIRAVAQSIERGSSVDPEVEESLRTVMSTVDRADRWLKDLLMAMRPVSIERSAVSLNSVVAEIADAAQDFATKRSVGLKLDCCADLPDLQLDPRRMTQALFSIVINAIEASPMDDDVKVVTRRSSDHPDMVEVMVEDHGPGIDPEVQKRMFTPFYGTKKSGTGVGLNLTQRIVFGHQGRIKVDSEPGSGCRMTILLPLQTNNSESPNGTDSDT